jgi:6-bladed beta-propeller
MNTRTLRSGLLCVSALVPLFACRYPAGEPASSPPAWLVDTVPELVIGREENDALTGVSDALRLPDGTIVVADAGAFQLRLYDRRGRFVRVIGRQGRGPGEFELPARVVALAPPDTFGVWDPMANRLSVFTPADGLVRITTPNTDLNRLIAPELHGVMQDGALVIGTGTQPAGILPAPDGVRRDSFTLVRYARDGRLLDTLGQVAGPEIYRRGFDGGFVTYLLPFARQGAVAVAREEVYVAETGTYRVLALRPGSPEPRPVVTDPARVGARVRGEDVERWRQELVAGLRSEEARRKRYATLRDVPSPAAMPVIGKMLTEPVGRLWVEDYAPWPDAPALWSVWEPATGRRVARGRVPAGVHVLRVEAGYLLGRSTDPDGVHHVVLYRLTGPADF